MSTEAHAPDCQEALAATLRCVQYRIHLSMRQQADDSPESERQVPDHHHDDDDDEPDTPDEPVDCDLMEPAVPKGANKKGVPRGRAVMLRRRPKLLPRTAAEKKGAARYTVHRDWQRIPDWMLRVKLVREAEALEALAAARGCSAQVYPTASMLAVPPFPLTITPKLRSTKSVVAPHQKRKRATDDDDDDEVIDAHDAKRRRVGSDASSLSRAVDRPVAGNPARGGRTGATANTQHKLTTSAASRVPRTRVPATPINCPAPRRSASVVGNAKVEKVLLSVPEFNRSGHVLLKREATPPQTSPPPRQRRMIPHPKAAPAVTTSAPADAPSPKQSSSAGGSTPTPTPTNKPLGRTMLSRQATSMFGAGVATRSSAPLLPSPSPSPSAEPSQASKPTPSNKPLGRTMLSRQSTTLFGAPGASAGESMPTPPPTSKPLGRTMLSRQATSLFGADVTTPSPSSSAPLSLSPSPSPSPSAGPSQASKPTPTNKPLGRTLLSRQPTSLFGAGASASEVMPTPTPTPTPTNRPLGRTLLSRQPTSLFGADVPTPRASAPSPQSSPPLSLSPPPTPSQASRPISTPYRAPSKKTVRPAPATALGKGKGKKAYREILPAPAPKPVPQVSTREEFRQRWIQVFGEEPPADPEAEAQMDDAASA